MSTTNPQNGRRSNATNGSWLCLALSFGGLLLLLVFYVGNEITPYATNRQGVLTGFFPRTVLCALLAIEMLAVVVGAGSFLLIRQRDMTSKAVAGIVLRNVCGIVAGLCTGLVLWIVAGHIVIGF